MTAYLAELADPPNDRAATVVWTITLRRAALGTPPGARAPRPRHNAGAPTRAEPRPRSKEATPADAHQSGRSQRHTGPSSGSTSSPPPIDAAQQPSRRRRGLGQRVSHDRPQAGRRRPLDKRPNHGRGDAAPPTSGGDGVTPARPPRRPGPPPAAADEGAVLVAEQVYVPPAGGGDVEHLREHCPPWHNGQPKRAVKVSSRARRASHMTVISDSCAPRTTRGQYAPSVP